MTAIIRIIKIGHVKKLPTIMMIIIENLKCCTWMKDTSPAKKMLFCNIKLSQMS